MLRLDHHLMNTVRSSLYLEESDLEESDDEQVGPKGMKFDLARLDLDQKNRD